MNETNIKPSTLNYSFVSPFDYFSRNYIYHNNNLNFKKIHKYFHIPERPKSKKVQNKIMLTLPKNKYLREKILSEKITCGPLDYISYKIKEKENIENLELLKKKFLLSKNFQVGNIFDMNRKKLSTVPSGRNVISSYTRKYQGSNTHTFSLSLNSPNITSTSFFNHTNSTGFFSNTHSSGFYNNNNKIQTISPVASSRLPLSSGRVKTACNKSHNHKPKIKSKPKTPRKDLNRMFSSRLRKNNSEINTLTSINNNNGENSPWFNRKNVRIYSPEKTKREIMETLKAKQMRKSLHGTLLTEIDNLNLHQIKNENTLYKILQNNSKKLHKNYKPPIREDIQKDLKEFFGDMLKNFNKEKTNIKEEAKKAFEKTLVQEYNFSTVNSKLISISDRIQKMSDEEALKYAEVFAEGYLKEREKSGFNQIILESGMKIDLRLQRMLLQKTKERFQKISRNNHTMQRICEQIRCKIHEIDDIYDNLKQKAITQNLYYQLAKK